DVPELDTVIHDRPDRTLGGKNVGDAVHIAAQLHIGALQAVERAAQAQLHEPRAITDRDHFERQIAPRHVAYPQAPPVAPGAETEPRTVAAAEPRNVYDRGDRLVVMMQCDDAAVERDAMAQAGGAVDRIENPAQRRIGTMRRG